MDQNVWNNTRVSAWLQNFHFWVNNPFKVAIIIRLKKYNILANIMKTCIDELLY